MNDVPALELVNSDQIVLKILLVSDPGVGKTSLFATANDVEEMSPAAVLDFEGGLLSVVHRKDVRRIKIRSIDTLERVFWKVANKDKDIEIDGVFPRSLIIDSATEMAELCLEEIARSAFAASQANSGLAHRESIDDVQLKDYGRSTKRLRRLFRWFRDVDDMNVLMTALPKMVYPQEPTDEKAKRIFQENIKRGFIKPVQVLPAFTDKLGTAVLGFVDAAWFLNIADVTSGEGDKKVTRTRVRQLVTQPVGPLRFIKTRGAKLAQALGSGIEIETVDGGSPRIQGVPAMKYIFDLYKSTEGGGSK